MCFSRETSKACRVGGALGPGMGNFIIISLYLCHEDHTRGYDTSTCLLYIIVGQVLGPICTSQQSCVCFWCQDGLHHLGCSQTPPYALTSLTVHLEGPPHRGSTLLKLCKTNFPLFQVDSKTSQQWMYISDNHLTMCRVYYTRRCIQMKVLLWLVPVSTTKDTSCFWKLKASTDNHGYRNGCQFLFLTRRFLWSLSLPYFSISSLSSAVSVKQSSPCDLYMQRRLIFRLLPT